MSKQCEPNAFDGMCQEHHIPVEKCWSNNPTDLAELRNEICKALTGGVFLYELEDTVHNESSMSPEFGAYYASDVLNQIDKISAYIANNYVPKSDLAAAMGHMQGCGHEYEYLVRKYPEFSSKAQKQKEETE